jgi:hypothetical protein
VGAASAAMVLLKKEIVAEATPTATISFLTNTKKNRG